MASTFRQQFRAGLYNTLVTVQTASPALLNTVTDYPPGSYQTPCAFPEKTVNERVEHDASLRRRVLTGTVVVVHKLISNKQATDEQDVLVDLIMDAFTAAFHGASGTTMIEPVSVTDTEITAGEGVRYSAAIITIEGSEQVGRF